MADESLIRCASCREVMKRQAEQTHPDGAAHLEFYACVACGRKLALWWELTGAEPTEDQRNWVEREVAKNGYFFPQDFTGGPGRFR